jgi:hypothetical protein
MRWVSGDDDDSIAAWERARLQAFINSGGASDYDTLYDCRNMVRRALVLRKTCAASELVQRS